MKKRMRRKRIREAVGNAVTFTITAVGILLIWSAVQAIEDGQRITYGLLQIKEFAEVLRRIPKSRKREARMMLEGFALCAESEKKVV